MGKFDQILCRLAAGEPAAILAPMAGISDLGMRRAAEDFGATLVVSEMLDSRYYHAGSGKAGGDGLACHVVQIAGCSPSALGEAARIAEADGADAIDINMGCPAKKVVGGLAGSALMRDLEQATALVRAVRAVVSVPVTVKMRLGWDDASRNAPELARRAQAEGVALVSVHGRTRCQFYTGHADWAAIRAVVEAVTIPVLANGDCTGIDDARAMLARSGAAGVMIGRAAVGRPWLVGEVAHRLRGGRARRPLAPDVRRDCALAHYGAILAMHGPAKGVRHARKHLAGYATHAGHPSGTALYARLMAEENPARVPALLQAVFTAAPGMRAA